MNGDAAIIGNGQSVLAFKAGGIDAFVAADETKARELLRKLAATYKVIFITDDLAEKNADLIERMNEQAYPVVVPVPSDKGAGTYATDRLKKQMERALGVDILFNRESK